MVLHGRRPVAQASRARLRKKAELRVRKQLKGSGVMSSLAKMIGPLLIKEAVKIGSTLVRKKISKKPKRKRRKKGGALRPAGARAPAGPDRHERPARRSRPARGGVPLHSGRQ